MDFPILDAQKFFFLLMNETLKNRCDIMIDIPFSSQNKREKDGELLNIRRDFKTSYLYRIETLSECR